MPHCYACKTNKPAEEFYRDVSRWSGRMSKCKECCKRSEKLKYVPKKRDGRISGDKLLERIKSGGCQICGYNKLASALELHHVNPGDKEISFSKVRSFRKIKGEVEKCVVLCANCHREVHAGFHDADKLPRIFVVLL